MDGNKIEIANLNFAYNEDDIIFENTHIELERGKIYLLTGENGCGKTTLLKLLSGLIGGGRDFDINWDGKKYRSFTQLKNKILYVNESPYLYDFLTGKENIELLIELFDIRKKKNQVFEFLEQFQLEGSLNKLVKEYSLGMKYKLFLAAVFVVETDVILLDEPFSSLDQDGQMIAQQLLDEFIENGGIAIVSTHVKDYMEKYKEYHYSINDQRLSYDEK